MSGKPGRSGGQNRKPNVIKRMEGNRGHRRTTPEPIDVVDVRDLGSGVIGGTE